MDTPQRPILTALQAFVIVGALIIIGLLVTTTGNRADAAPYPAGVRSNAVLISEFDNCQASTPCRNRGSKELDLLMARVVVNGKGPWTRCADFGGSGSWQWPTVFDHKQIICFDVDT